MLTHRINKLLRHCRADTWCTGTIDCCYSVPTPINLSRELTLALERPTDQEGEPGFRWPLKGRASSKPFALAALDRAPRRKRDSREEGEAGVEQEGRKQATYLLERAAENEQISRRANLTRHAACSFMVRCGSSRTPLLSTFGSDPRCLCCGTTAATAHSGLYSRWGGVEVRSLPSNSTSKQNDAR